VARSRPPGLHDVARLAGVSYQTVSRVINGSPRLRPETKARVEAAIAELGYRPNLAARALATNRPHLIGVILTGPHLYGPTSIHEAVATAAKAAGWFCGSVRLPEMTDGSLAEALDFLSAQQAAIVIIAGQQDVIARARAQATSVSLVVVEGDLSGAADAVGVDSYRGGYLATRHLLELGHQVVGHVAGPRTWAEAQARWTGWRDALTDAGLDAGPLATGDWTAASGYAAGQRLARSRATALFVANDEMAIGVLQALHDAGRRVPDDISVVGFDDMPEAAYLLPPLTTMRQDFAEVGQRVIDLLSDQFSGDPHEQQLVAPELVVRRSTAPPG